MLDSSQAEDALVKARKFAEEHDLADNLDQRLNYLATFAGGERTRCRLFPDWAPLSFEFVMERLNEAGQWIYWFNGGLIYHGSHDGHGSGAAPTFAVTVTPTTGWSIHT